MSDTRTAKLRQGIWCDHGQHVIPQGEQYEVDAAGLFCCLACLAADPLSVPKAGSLE